ncbi:hypothetical protein K457DRAFT_132249 [Linnemannia elongata AG-77]|uniref:Uncharacterized protein n=1 Tax=Linnemannia elongata AG-77 TaxID=1314771 RepID=A0A197KFG9_9FUNG|nr:hypothetical protein K457DRAFT_132249 [Linnemannia elongata AG-77]
MLSFHRLLCWLSCTILLIHAAPVPPPLSTFTPSTAAATTTSSSPWIPSMNEEKRSSAFADLLRDPVTYSFPGLILYPDPPPIPNVVLPVIPPPEPHLQPPIPTGAPYRGVPEYPSGGFVDVALLGVTCLANRMPNFPDSIPIAVGVIRLFRKPTYRDEAAVVRGCGCVRLESPILIESFVASTNHAVAFYTTANCEGLPYFQRFYNQYDVEPNMVANSIKIIQGVVEPLPSPQDGGLLR